MDLRFYLRQHGTEPRTIYYCLTRSRVFFFKAHLDVVLWSQRRSHGQLRVSKRSSLAALGSLSSRSRVERGAPTARVTRLVPHPSLSLSLSHVLAYKLCSVVIRTEWLLRVNKVGSPVTLLAALVGVPRFRCQDVGATSLSLSEFSRSLARREHLESRAACKRSKFRRFSCQRINKTAYSVNTTLRKSFTSSP